MRDLRPRTAHINPEAWNGDVVPIRCSASFVSWKFHHLCLPSGLIDKFDSRLPLTGPCAHCAPNGSLAEKLVLFGLSIGQIAQQNGGVKDHQNDAAASNLEGHTLIDTSQSLDVPNGRKINSDLCDFGVRACGLPMHAGGVPPYFKETVQCSGVIWVGQVDASQHSVATEIPLAWPRIWIGTHDSCSRDLHAPITARITW